MSKRKEKKETMKFMNEKTNRKTKFYKSYVGKGVVVIWYTPDLELCHAYMSRDIDVNLKCKIYAKISVTN